MGVTFTLSGLWQWVEVALVVKDLPATAEVRKRSELDCQAWQIPWRRKWQPHTTEGFALENPMDRGA